MSLKEEHQTYIARLRAAGKQIVAYQCPHCCELIETLAAPKGQVWDSVSACPDCNELHMKYTVGDFASATTF